MPGCWEMAGHSSVLCAVLHVDTTTVAWAIGLRNLQMPNSGVMALTGMPYDHARNIACMRAIEMGAEWLFFLDSDVVPPPDAVLRLISHNQPIISGLYCRRSPPHGVPVMLRGGQWITELPDPNQKNPIIEVELVGAGCMLIHRSVLQSLPPQRHGKHWFDWRVDMKGSIEPMECLSEDFTFCRHAHRQGYKILVDTSIRCKHIGYAVAEYGSFIPLQT